MVSALRPFRYPPFSAHSLCPSPTDAVEGADILAHADDEHHQYQVFIPDFFFGKPADRSWLPFDNQEKKEKLGAFFQTAAAPPKNAEKVPRIVKEITEKTGGTIQKWGALGMCWGGKVRSTSAVVLPPGLGADNG